MSLNPYLKAWSGDLYRHIPEGSPYGVLDFRYAGLVANNRWNSQGEPTIYLASDFNVALVEFARHIRAERSLPASAPLKRRVFRLHVAVQQTLDLREESLWEALHLMNAPFCFSDRKVARATAKFLRDTTPAEALLVPSMGFLDQLDRWSMVLFLDKLPDQGIRVVDEQGVFDVRGS